MPEMISVTSSNILAVGYDKETTTLYITFKSNKTYLYDRVPASVYEELMAADSVGKYFNQFIKNNYGVRINS